MKPNRRDVRLSTCDVRQLKCWRISSPRLIACFWFVSSTHGSIDNHLNRQGHRFVAIVHVKAWEEARKWSARRTNQSQPISNTIGSLIWTGAGASGSMNSATTLSIQQWMKEEILRFHNSTRQEEDRRHETGWECVKLLMTQRLRTLHEIVRIQMR